MKLAVLRISGPGWSPDEVIESIEQEPDSIWHAGDETLRGRRHADSGVNYCVADTATTPELISEIRAFAQKHGAKLAEMAARGLRVELCIGMTVGHSQQYTATVPFDSADLRLLGDLGINLVFSAYPTSDAANTDEVRALADR